MSLRVIAKKYLKDDWTDEEKSEIRKSKIELAREHLGRVRHTEDDIMVLVMSPDSVRARQLKENYESLCKTNYPFELDCLGDVAKLHYLHKTIPNAKFYSGDDIEAQERGANFLVKEDPSFSFRMQFLVAGNRSFRKLGIYAPMPGLDELKKNFRGKARFGFHGSNSSMDFDKFTEESAYTELFKTLIKDEDNFYSSVELVMGENVMAAISNLEALSITAYEYTPSLDRILGLINLQ